MPASPEKLAANRANSQKSTGPKTPEGKQISRANALKHGLTGDGIALHTEDAAEVQRRFTALQAELNPAGALGCGLVGRIALLLVRLERCALQESAALSERVRNAPATFDDDRAAAVEDLFNGLDTAPAINARLLRQEPEGVDRLIRAWLGLAADLNDHRPHWTDGHTAAAENLLGCYHGEPSANRVGKLGAIVSGASHAYDLADAQRTREQARAQLAAVIASEIAALRAHRKTLDLSVIAADRAGAANRALFDPSPRAVLARKYEAAAERGLFRALRELRESEKALAASGGPVATFAGPPACDELASFFPAPEAAASAPEPEPEPVAASVRKVNGSEPKAYNPAWESDVRQISIGRASAAATKRCSEAMDEALAG